MTHPLDLFVIDRLIAEQVMGRLWRTNQRGVEGWACRSGDDDDVAPYVTKQSDWDGRWVDADTENFSTKISDAWDVIERMNSLGYRARLEIDEDGLIFRANFPSVSEHGELIWTREGSDAETAPLAICLAALAALDK